MISALIPLAVASVLSFPQARTNDEAVEKKVDAIATDFLAKPGAVGLSIGVGRKGELVFAKGYGLADAEFDVPANADTMFRIGSITKQFTAAAILKLETEGKLKVEDRLSVHLEGVPEDKKDVTLHHLLTHTAGLDHVYGEDDDYAPRDLAVKLFLRMPLLSKPGERYHYSNPGFSLLAAV
ncbi:MAG: serine hydrolase domain-containing protein, partial [Steroidobacteraceae bacterium]